MIIKHVYSHKSMQICIYENVLYFHENNVGEKRHKYLF